MLRRLLVGLLIGLVIGGLMAGVLLKGLNAPLLDGTGGAVMAYLFAALTGVITGLVAGKPIWASGGQIEAGLKAVFGALLAAGGMFALRQWAHVHINLSVIDPKAIGQLGDLPLAALPLIGGVLGTFYELDNTGTGEKDDKKAAKGAGVKGETGNGKARIAVDAADADEDVDVASKKAKR